MRVTVPTAKPNDLAGAMNQTEHRADWPGGFTVRHNQISTDKSVPLYPRAKAIARVSRLRGGGGGAQIGRENSLRAIRKITPTKAGYLPSGTGNHEKVQGEGGGGGRRFSGWLTSALARRMSSRSLSSRRFLRAMAAWLRKASYTLTASSPSWLLRMAFSVYSTSPPSGGIGRRQKVSLSKEGVHQGKRALDGFC